MVLSTLISWGILLSEKVETADIRDIKGPVLYGWNLSFLLIVGLSLIFMIGLLIISIRRVKNKHRISLFRPAHEIAYEALQQLRKKDLLKKGEIDGYYFELSRAIRRYLQDRFSYQALEMTTEQLLMMIRDSKKLSQEQKGLLSTFFMHCDLVKFAGYRPPAEETDWAFTMGQQIIDQTKEDVSA
jgi:hypothetical protein